MRKSILIFLFTVITSVLSLAENFPSKFVKNGNKYKIYSVYNIEDGSDYTPDPQGWMGDIYIYYTDNDSATTFKIEQNRVFLKFVEEEQLFEAEDNIIETTYSINKWGEASDQDGNYGEIFVGTTQDGREFRVVVGYMGKNSDGESLYGFMFLDGVFDNLVWIFDPNEGQ